MWCDTQVCESRHWANVVDNVYHVYAKRFLLTFEFEIAVNSPVKIRFDPQKIARKCFSIDSINISRTL